MGHVVPKESLDLRVLKEFRVKWVQRVKQVLPETWELRVAWALLVLPVALVLLALLVQSDPRVRQVLLGWLLFWLPNSSPAPG